MAEKPAVFGSPAQYGIEQIVSKVHENFAQEIIQVSADRAHRYLADWQQRVERRSDWIGRLSLFCTLSLTLLTADFKDRFNIAAQHWTSLYEALTILSILWLGKTLYANLFDQVETPDEMVEKFKNSPPPPPKHGLLRRAKEYYGRGHHKM